MPPPSHLAHPRGARSALEEAAAGLAHPTRRDVVKAAGVAAVGATPVVRAAVAGISLARPLTVRAEGGRIQVLSGRAPLLTIEAARFAGSPRLSSRALGDGRTEVRMSGARWPGTALSADFRLVLDTAPRGDAVLELALGALTVAVPAAAWLSGRKQAVGRARFDGQAFPVGAGGVSLHGDALVTVGPDLALSLTGKGIASAMVFGSSVVADAVTLRLPSAGEESLLTKRIARRALVTLERGARRWDLAPAVLAPAHGAFEFAPDAVSALTFETAESVAGRVYRVAVAEAPSAVRYSFGERSRAAGSVPLTGVRIAAAHDAAGDGVAIVADAPGRTWVRGNGVSYCVGDDGVGTPFAATGRAVADRVSWAPRVYAVSAPLPGALVSPITFPDGAPAVLRLGTEKVARGVGAQAIVIDPPIIEPPIITLPDAADVTVVRPADMLNVKFLFYNIAYSAASKKLYRKNVLLPSRIAVVFPPQSVFEQAFALTSPVLTGTPPVRSLISGPSMLAFRLPDATIDAGIPLTMTSLLDWGGWEPLVQEVAKRVPAAGASFTPTDPRATSLVTFIEAPYRMFLSPNEDSWWKLSSAPLAGAKWVPLWHARLQESRTVYIPLSADAGSGGIESQAIGGIPIKVPVTPPTVRAVWSPDVNASDTDPNVTAPQFPGVTGAEQSLKAIDRRDIVKLTATLRDDPVEAPLMMLTSLGSWLTAEGHWRNVAVDLIEWKHRMTLGRDHFVRVVRDGYLYPFGHRAVYVEITERQFATSPVTGRKTAYLFKRRFIIVIEKEKTYSFSGLRDRMSPFRTIRVLTKQTPNLDTPAKFVNGITTNPVLAALFPAVGAYQCFVPKVAGADYLFECEAVDISGQTKQFQVPVAWVSRTTDTTWANLNSIQFFFRGLGKKTDLRGQAVAYAAPADKPEATRFETKTFYFGSYVPSSGSAEWTAVADFRPHFWPRLQTASIRLADAAKLSGNEANTTVEYWETYLQNGWGTGEVFLKTVTAMALPLGGQNAGGLMTPNMSVAGISRKRGAVSGDLATFNNGTFDPTKFFGSSTTGTSAQSGALDAKLFGSFALSQILKAINGLGTDTDPTSPRISTRTEGNDAVVAMDWKYTWANTETLVSVFLARGGSTTLSLHSEVRTPMPGYTGETKSKVTGELTDFKLGLLDASAPWIALDFERITFKAESGKGTDVDPKIRNVEFGQALAFLAELQKYMGFASAMAGSSVAAAGTSAQSLVSAQEGTGGLSIDVSGSGITASLSLAIPSIAVGPFSLSNIVIGAKLTIPFTGGKVTVGFNVSSKEKPFQLAVMAFGGQGYFEMVFSADGLESLTISFEFGIIMALNFGVASGSVSITGGFTYMMTKTSSGETGVKFEAFIKMSGELSILGIIELCITFTLTLEYMNKALGNGRETLTGQCEVTVSVKLVFFKISTSFTVRRELSGSDPLFIEMMPADKGTEAAPLSTMWDEYCDAFAPIVVGG